MLYETYNGESTEIVFGDVVFSVFNEDDTPSEPQHAGLSNVDAPRIIQNSNDKIEVIEYPLHSGDHVWPRYGYKVDLVGKMKIDGKFLDEQIRLKIIRRAQRIERRGSNTVDNIHGTLECKYSLKNYKCVRPVYHDLDSATSVRFSCAGFVEYCYEEAGYDIVKEGKDGELLPLVNHPFTNEQINRLFPGYQIKAFKYDKYPLDFDDMRKQGLNPRDYEYYPFP